MQKVDGVVGVCYVYAIIDSCINEGSVEAQGSALGGIVGNAYYIVQNCENKGSITTNANSLGGIAGVNAGMILSCKNSGNITGSFTSSTYVGGVVGEQHISVVGMSFLDVIIKECCNIGNISGNTCIGGIIGRSGNNATVDSCYNIGNVSGTQRVGGVIGDSTLKCESLKNLYNKGSVTATINYVGGIVGILYSTLENAYNTGTVSMTSSSNTTFGGVTGHINTDYVTIDIIQNCYYLNTCSSKAVGNVSAIDTTSSKTSEEMKNLANTLGEGFKNSTEGDGYPKLSWEK